MEISVDSPKMSLEETILARRSVRGFLDIPVPREIIDEALELACEKYGALLKVEVDCDSYLPSDIADSLEQVFIQCDAEDARKLESIKDKLDQAGCKHRIVKAGQLGF